MNCLVCLQEINKSKFKEYHDTCFRNFFGTTKISPRLPFTRKEFFEERSKASSVRIGLSGVQPKLGVKIDEAVLETTNVHPTHIIKPTPEGWPNLAQNEHLTMLISKLVGIETAECALIRFADNELVYVTRRFDLIKAGGKIHQEDMMQAMGIQADVESNAKYEARSYEEVCNFLTQNSSIALAAKLFERIFFNFMVSNDDFHLKNISIQYLNKTIKLSPHYDSLNTGIYGPPQRELACSLFKDNSGFSKAHDVYGFHSQKCFEEFARAIGLKPRAMNKIFVNFEEKWDAILELVEKSFLEQRRKDSYIKELNSRREKFLLSKVKQ